MGPTERRFVFWAVVAVGAVILLRRIGIAALFGAKGTADSSGAGAAGFGAIPPTIFDTTPGTVTAPHVTPTPVTATQAQPNANGIPVGLSLISQTPYYGVTGSKPADLVIAPRKTDSTNGASVISANVPGTPLTQGVSPADSAAFSTFHAQDAAVVAQQLIEANSVSPAQRGKGQFIGYRNDGTPLLVYGPG